MAKNRPDENANPLTDLIPGQGERALIVGQTGSGKTQFASWLLERLPTSPLIIYDTKGEQSFETLPRSVLVTSERGLAEMVDNPEIDYVVFRIPPHMTADDKILDGLLMTHFLEYQDCVAYIDELFSFSQNGRAGPGLVALLTQGRSKGITTIMSAQRPAWLSRFAITEAQRFYVFNLIDDRDKKQLGNVIKNFADLPDPPEFSFYYYRAGKGEPRLMKPIPLDKAIGNVYNGDTTEPNDAPDKATSLNWI